jgi:Fe-S cluster assembly protein SufD
MHVKPSAKVTYLEAQLQGDEIFLVNRSTCLVDRDGRYESLTLALGGCQTKSDMATILRAPGASSGILGVVLGSGEEKFSFNTIQEHTATDTTSDINFRVALKDKSSSVYEGIVRVAKVAQRTSAYQSNKNLLLDGTATADSIPKLEILADDVKCSHGATVGPVDREQIFYLMSRGVSRSVAEQLVVLGFFRQTLEQFSFNTGLSWLSENVSRKMHGGTIDASATDFFVEPD